MINRKEQFKKITKKGLGIGLCAVLAGGVSAVTFEGAGYLSGLNPASVEAAANAVTLSRTDSSDTSGIAASGMDVSGIVEDAMPSVVSITTKSIEEVNDYYGMFRRFGGYAPQQRETEGSGSGIIIGKSSSELLIATNYHVIEGADTVSVSFIDGNSYEAIVKGTDEDRDLAVVSVSVDDVDSDTLDAISVASIGDSDELKVGEQVVAIGNALGYGQSVTTGIVSAKNRRIDGRSEEDGVNLIQTDAAINPGNSGGALLNMNGELVGINSAKMASTDVEGIGYAIAISDVADVLETLMNTTPRTKLEDSPHGVLGITGTTVSEESAQMYNIPEGVFVVEVTEDSAADQAGITENSVITEFDGKRVRSIEELVGLLEYYEPGEEVEVTVDVMADGGYEEKTVDVTLDESTDSVEEEESEQLYLN